MTDKQRIQKIKQILNGNGCDKCDQIDGDYHKTVHKNGQQLAWNSSEKMFVCPRWHKESFDDAYRNESLESLYGRLKAIAEII